MQTPAYPVTFSVDYPDRPLNRTTTAFRIFTVIPIAIVLGTVSGASWAGGWQGSGTTSNRLNDGAVSGGSSVTGYHFGGQPATFALVAGGLLIGGPLLMILFRQKYPRWWFDWNLQLQRFINRVSVYLALMTDQYPSTDEQQSVHLNYEYPNV